MWKASEVLREPRLNVNWHVFISLLVTFTHCYKIKSVLFLSKQRVNVRETSTLQRVLACCNALPLVSWLVKILGMLTQTVLDRLGI